MKINFDQVPAYIKREITVGEAGLFKGKKGKQVQRVQEWLAVHGFHTVIDGDYGPATNSAVRGFQKVKGLDDTGAVDQATWSLLCKPMDSALRAPSKRPLSINALVEFFARRHLKQNPKEIGGSNRGPWVRLYCDGNDGREWAWCAGFVSLIVRQAYFYFDKKPPMEGSVSCDTLAAQGKSAGLFIKGQDLRSGKIKVADLTFPLIFLRKKTHNDWNHTGFVMGVEGEGKDLVFITIEGNTNNLGHREGVEACARRRSVASGNYDFLKVEARVE